MKEYDENYTEFLPARLIPQDKILKSYNFFNSEKLIKSIFESIPGYFLILNDCRQVVYANSLLSSIIHGRDIRTILGLRPGEIFNCVNAITSPGGCGTSKACIVCGAGTALHESMTNANKSEKECRITTTHEDNLSKSMELNITAAPLSLNGDQYYILALSDQSDEKRRMVLERIFLHDVVNVAGGLKNIITMLKTPKQIDASIDLLQLADISASILLEEIETHRSLISAESGELKTNFQETSTSEVLLDVVNILARNDTSHTKIITIAENAENIIFSTDKVILRRVLINMAKNALEAPIDSDEVTLGCCKNVNNEEFTVNNKGMMPEDIQHQIFQRSFSTKGNNRGIGTYSIKLITERYLKGTVSFTSNEETGTTFFAKYPIDPNRVCNN